MANDNKPINNFPTSTKINSLSRILGIDDTANTVLYEINDIKGDFKGGVSLGTEDPGTPVLAQYYNAKAGVTYANFKDDTNTAITIPSKVGAQYVAGAQLIFDGAHWKAEWGLQDAPDLSEDYTTKVDFNGISQVSVNKFDLTRFDPGHFWGTTGSKQANSNWKSSLDKIPVTAGVSITIGGISTTYVGNGYKADGSFNEKINADNVTLKTGAVFIPGGDTVSIGINTDSVAGQDHSTTAFVIETASLPADYIPGGIIVNPNKIPNLPAYAKQTDFTVTKAKVDLGLDLSYNLADGSLSMHGKAYGNSVAPLYPAQTSASGDALPPIRIKPNTDYYLEGIFVDFPGSLFNEDFSTRIKKISEPVSNSTAFGFNSGAAVWACINISKSSASQPGKYDNSVQLTEGTVSKAYLPFGSTLKWNKVTGKPTIPNGYSDVYYSFTVSTNEFIIYYRITGSTNLYEGVKVALRVNAAIRQNCWGITGADLYAFDGITMAAQGKIMLSYGLENEYVYKQNGKTGDTTPISSGIIGIDGYTGGYHGNETYDSYQFFIDGVALTLPVANVALTPCSRFHYQQISKMLESDITSVVVQGKHIKITEFFTGGFDTGNTMIWDAALSGPITIDEFFGGLLAVGKPLATNAYTKRSAIQAMTGSGTTYFNEINGSNEFFTNNPTNSLSSKTTVSVLTALKNGVDVKDIYFNKCKAQVWDRLSPSDSKVYFRTQVGNGVVFAYANDIWTVKLQHRVNYKS